MPRSGVYVPPLAAILLLALLVATYYFAGLYGSDDFAYINGAIGLGRDTPAYAVLGGARYTVSLPLRLFLETAGGEAQLAAIGFSLIYVLSVGALYFVISKAYGWIPASYVALFIAACPLFFFFSGAVLPDNILSVLFCLSVIAFGCWINSIERAEAPADWAVFLASGLAALCYVTKDAAGAFFLPVLFFGSAGLVRVQVSRNIAAVFRSLSFALAGCSLVVFCDALLSQLLYGDPLIRLTFAREMDLAEDVKKFMSYQGVYPWERWATTWSHVSRYWPTAPVFIAACGAMMWHSRRKLLSGDMVICISALWVITFLTLGSVSFREYVGIPIQARYFTPAALLLCVVAGRATALLHERARSRLARRSVIAAAISVALFQIGYPLDKAGDVYRAREHRALLETLVEVSDRFPRVPIYSDRYFSQRALSYGNLDGVNPIGSSASSSPFILVYNAAGSDAPENRPWVRCASAGMWAKDIRRDVEPTLFQTRAQRLISEFGFVQWAGRQVPSGVGVILVEAPRNCDL